MFVKSTVCNLAPSITKTYIKNLFLFCILLLGSFAQLTAYNGEESDQLNIQVEHTNRLGQEELSLLNFQSDFVFNSSNSNNRDGQTKLDIRISETQEEDNKPSSSKTKLLNGVYFTKTLALQRADILLLFNAQKRLLLCKRISSTSRHIVFQVFRI